MGLLNLALSVKNRINPTVNQRSSTTEDATGQEVIFLYGFGSGWHCGAVVGTLGWESRPGASLWVEVACLFCVRVGSI